MPIRCSLAEVGARLQETISTLPGSVTSPAELYDRYAEIAIEVLDSESDNYTPGALQEYLETYLYLKQLELGLIPFPDPREE